MPRIKVAVGVSPENAESYDDATSSSIRAAAQAHKAHAIGACGLNAQASDAQRLAFRDQIGIAKASGLPLVVESNGAHGPAFDLLEGEGFPFERVLVHAFHGEDAELARWAQAGSYVSFAGWSADDPLDLNRQVALIPAERVLVESGAPDQVIDALAGLPARCDQVVFVADAIIGTVGAQQLEANAIEFFCR